MNQLNGVLHVIDPPQHGTLAADPNDPRSVLYTPAQDYQGLDSFTYQWEYDQLDYWTHQPVGRLLTNVASQAIQVGNWVDLVPDNTYQNDPHHGISGVGEQETMTLTLQNPRGDGLPCTGYWSLYFDRSMIHVYTSDGKEVLPDRSDGWAPPGSRFIEQIPGYGSKTLTLRVVGVGAGTATITAYWTVWGCSVGQLGWIWATDTAVGFSILDADIDSDNNSYLGLYGGPDHTRQEEYLEDNPYGLGKIVIPNWGDTDGDGIPDCWDGYWVGTAYLGQDDPAPRAVRPNDGADSRTDRSLGGNHRVRL